MSISNVGVGLFVGLTVAILGSASAGESAPNAPGAPEQTKQKKEEESSGTGDRKTDPKADHEVVVTASPIVREDKVTREGERVSVVGEQQIEDLNAQDLSSALRRVPGVTISRYNQVGSYGGGDGGAIFIRGQGSGRPGAEISTTVDGIPRVMGIWTHPLLDNLELYLGGTLTDTIADDWPNTPEASGVLGFTYTYKNWRFNADAQWIGDRFVDSTRFEGAAELMEDDHLVNARVSYTFQLPKSTSLELFSAVENLTDSQYEYRPGYPMPGITWSFGLNFRF